LRTNYTTDTYKTAFKRDFYYVGLVTIEGDTRITYVATSVTDLNLLNDSREKSEMLIDVLYSKWKLLNDSVLKPRTYREIARKEYLKVAQKKHKTKREIRHAAMRFENNLTT
jgi:hypothetical protein